MEGINTDNNPEVTVPVHIDPVEIKTVTAKSTTKVDPPLFSLSVTNPVTYLKNWWKKLIGNEGVKLTIQIKPVTAFILAAIFCGAGFGFGRLTIPEPLIRYIPILPSPIPSPTPNPWKETAFTGKLQVSGNRYFLTTTSAEAITLEVPQTINLKPVIGKRILVVGQYNKETKVMKVSSIPDLEILPNSPVPLPTLKPSPSPSPSPSPPML